MGFIGNTYLFNKFSGVITAGLLAFAFVLFSPHHISAEPLTTTTSWQQIRDNFAHMSARKKLAVLIAVNARAENRHTIAVNNAATLKNKSNALREVKHFLEKTKLLRELAHYTHRADLRQVFTAEIRAIKSYLRGEMARPDLDRLREKTNHRIKDIIVAIKNKGLFLDQLHRSKQEISLIGDTIYMMAKTRTTFVYSGI